MTDSCTRVASPADGPMGRLRGPSGRHSRRWATTTLGSVVSRWSLRCSSCSMGWWVDGDRFAACRCCSPADILTAGRGRRVCPPPHPPTPPHPKKTTLAFKASKPASRMQFPDPSPRPLKEKKRSFRSPPALTAPTAPATGFGDALGSWCRSSPGGGRRSRSRSRGSPASSDLREPLASCCRRKCMGRSSVSQRPCQLCRAG